MSTLVDWSAKAVLRDVTSEGAADHREVPPKTIDYPVVDARSNDVEVSLLTTKGTPSEPRPGPRGFELGSLEYPAEVHGVDMRDSTRSREVVVTAPQPPAIDVSAIALPYPEVGLGHCAPARYNNHQRGNHGYGDSANKERTASANQSCVGGCECTECGAPQSAARYDPLSFINPLQWMQGFRLGAPNPATQYRIISYDVDDGVQRVQRFEGALRLIVPTAGSADGAPTVAPMGKGSWLRGLGAIARIIIDGRGDARGVVAYRQDGSWAVALDVTGDGAADILHVIRPGGLSHLFANALGRDALRDWMEHGRNPLCVGGLDPASVRVPRGAVRGCGGDSGLTSPPGSSHAAPGSAPGVGQASGPGDPSDILCGGIGTGMPPNLGGTYGSPSPSEWNLHGEIMARMKDRKLGQDWFFNAVSPEYDERHPYHRENPYVRQGLTPEDPRYPRVPSDPFNFYGEGNPMGRKYVGDISTEALTAPIAADPPRRFWERARESAPTPPPNPFDDPGVPEDGVPPQALLDLCEHYRRMRDNPTLRQQMEDTIRQMCVDATGQPDPDGGVGSVCAGFKIELTGDVLGLVGDSRCSGSDYGRGECDESSVQDRLRNERRWRAFVGVQLTERCNSLICRDSDAIGAINQAVDHFGENDIA